MLNHGHLAKYLGVCITVFISYSSAAFAGPSLLVPVTAFSNMEHGWQITNRGYVAILTSKKTGRTIMAGHMSMEAVTKGQKLDAAPGATAPTLLLNIEPKFVDTQGISQIRPDESVNGTLSICLANDLKQTLIQNAKCRVLKSDVSASHDDRNFQLIDIPVIFKAIGKDLRIVRYDVDNSRIGREGSNVAIAASVYHPIYQFLAPGKAYKDNQSPLVLDLECLGNLDLINVWDEKFSVKFDLEGDGIANLTGWAGPESGLLVIDRNGDGKINDGRELFSEYSYGFHLEKKVRKRFVNGFEALNQYDANGDGSFDSNDPAFKFVQVWNDRNSNGKSEKAELFSLNQLGIDSFDLNYRENIVDGRYVVQADNEVRQLSSFARKDGKNCTVADVWFKQRRHPERK